MTFADYLNESAETKVQPKTKRELKQIIEDTIKEKGFNCDLNFIDTSKITDMSGLFFRSEFNGDISKWDVSNVRRMSLMFCRSNFDGDISKWNVSNVRNMKSMFEDSVFNGDISKWDVSNVKDMSHMFADSIFNGDISKWDVSNIKYCLNESVKSTTFEEILSSIDCSENIKTLLVKFCRNEHIKPSDVEKFCGYDTLEEYFEYALTHYTNLMYIESKLLSMSLPPLWDDDFEKDPRNTKALVRKFNSSKIGDPIASWDDFEFVFKASDSTILGKYAKEVDFQEVAKYGYLGLDGKNVGRGSQEEKDKYDKFYMKSIYPKLDKLKLK